MKILSAMVAVCCLSLGLPTLAIAEPSVGWQQSRHLSADVDGDGRADQVSVRPQPKGRERLTVRFAAGGISSLELRVNSEANGSSPTFGATAMNGLPGDEIVVLTDDSPASFAFYKVVTARGRQLHFLPPPPHQRWFVGASAGAGGEGYTCHKRSLTLVLDGPAHPHADGTVTFRESRTTYRWATGGWNVVRHRVNPRAVNAGAGWRCPGLETL